ncbi:hemerythrin domain-containing protein [Kitasatospora sp. NPDC127111]|uniref:hemerythrin domain-containing protein n=1 Tax=Kitasatospora sp. NPDC127111 TaxID=3345363 RepID=UPI003644F369
MSDRLDMAVVDAMHGALRRELRHIADVTARSDPDPRQVLRTSTGWELFKRALRAHHSAEDDALWPALRRALRGRPYDLTRLEAIEAEHATLAALVTAIDDALTCSAPVPATGPDLFGVLTGSLVTGLAGHLGHEEDAVFPLVQVVLSEEQWAHFGRTHAERIGPHAELLVPWLLDGADERAATAVLARLPEPARRAYGERWRPAYAALDRWSAPLARA